MSKRESKNKKNGSFLQRRHQLLIAVLLIVGAAIFSFILIARRPPVAKREIKETALLVRTWVVHQTDVPVQLPAFGTVQEHRILNLVPEVGGRVVEQSEKLVVGGLFKENELLLRIDPRDYEVAIDQEEAAVARAEFDLKLEQGRKVVAEREWELLDPQITSNELGRDLALRVPQIAEKQASLEAAVSRLEKAKLDLERTELRAPFAVQVVTESVELGQVVTPQSMLATLVATDEFRVQLSVPMNRLQWIRFPHEEGEQGARVRILQDLGGGTEVERIGYVVRLQADVEPQGRMARVQVAVKDPLSLETPDYRDNPLLLHSYVRAVIDGPLLEGVYRIPRRALREGSIVWIRRPDSTLEIRRVTPLFSGEDYVILKEGLEDGDELVNSPIPIPIPGMRLEVASREDPMEAP